MNARVEFLYFSDYVKFKANVFDKKLALSTIEMTSKCHDQQAEKAFHELFFLISF